MGSAVAPKVSQFFEVRQGQRKLWRTTRKKKGWICGPVFNLFFLLLPTDLLSSNSVYIQIFLALEIDKADDQVVAMELDNGVSTLGWDLHSLGVFNTDKSFGKFTHGANPSLP